MAFYIGYYISIALHVLGFYWGIKTLFIGDSYFNKTSPRDFFRSYVERKHVATVCGTVGNFFFILSKVPYIVMFSAHGTGWIEPIFLVGHLSIGIALAIYHYNALEAVTKEIQNERLV